MVLLAATLLVATSSGGLLTDHSPRGVRLLEAPLPPSYLLGQFGPVYGQGGAAGLNYDTLTLDQAKAEYARLKQANQGPVAGIAATFGGGGVILLSLILIGVGAGLFDGGALVLVGVLLFLAGGAALAVGIVLWANGIREQEDNERRLRALKQRIDDLSAAPQPMAPPPNFPPPPSYQPHTGLPPPPAAPVLTLRF